MTGFSKLRKPDHVAGVSLHFSIAAWRDEQARPHIIEIGCEQAREYAARRHPGTRVGTAEHVTTHYYVIVPSPENPEWADMEEADEAHAAYVLATFEAPVWEPGKDSGDA